VIKPEIETTGSRVVYQNRWMTVREDTVQRADGSPGIFGIVDKPDFAVIAAMHEDCVLMVEQYRYPVQERFWELPQGSWEGDAIDPQTLARSELLEETGVLAHSIFHVGHLYLGYGYSTQGYNVFLASELEFYEAKLDPEEQGLIAKSFKIAEVKRMVLDGIIKDATTVAAFGLLQLKGYL
jgi:ADP-ribose pyrophosphatase